MRKFYFTFLLTLISLVFSNNLFANRDSYPNSVTLAGGGVTHCQGSPGSELTATVGTTTCGGGGTTNNINITVSWYSNTINSTVGGTLVSSVASTTATTTYTYTPSTAAVGTLYYYVVVTWGAGTVCAVAGSVTSATQKVVIDASSMTYSSSAVDQYATSNIDLNCTDVTNAILEMKITVTGSSTTCPAYVTQFNFTTAGSTNASGDISQARVYYTQQNAGYNAFYFFGLVNNPNGAFSITGSQALLLGAGTYYFYLCYSVPSTATSGDVVDAGLSSFVINGTAENNMSPNPTASVTLGGGSCSPTPDLPNPASNIETITAGSLVIPMDNSHQCLWMGRPFNTKAYGLVRALLMQDIPVKWVIKSGKIKDSSDFSATCFEEYPTVGSTGLQYFKSGEFIVDTTYLARSVYPGEQTAAQVIAAFAPRWKVAIYKLSSNISVDVRYTLNHRPKIALFNNGGYQALQLGVLDSAKVWTSPNVDTALSAGSFGGLAECYTFCSESHWDNTTAPNYPADTNVVSPVWQFVEEGGNFLAQCAGIDKYENQMQHPRHFESSRGIRDQNNQVTNTYANPDMAFGQFDGTVVSRGGTVASFEVSQPADTSIWRPEMYKVVYASTGDSIVAAGVHLGNPDSTGGNVFYLAGHDYQSSNNPSDGNEIGVLNYINGARMYLNAAFVPANRPDPTPLQAGSNVTICQGGSTTIGGSPTGPASGSGTTYTWSPSTGLNNPNSANPVASPTVTTTYTVFVNSSGCAYSPASVVVTVIPTPAAPTVTSNSPVCVGSTLNLNASTVTGATYSWTGPNTFSSSSQNPSISSVTVAAAGTYSVVATISGCPGPAGTGTVAISITPTVTVSGPVTICSGNSTTLTASGATTYSWTPNTNLSATTGASVSASPTVTTTYSVTGTTGSCTSSSATVVVTVNPTPTVTLSAPPTICSGNSTTLTASGATTYTWTPSSSLSASTGTSVSATPTVTTTYSVTGTTGTCTSTAATVIVTVNPTPTVTLSAPPTICSGGSTVLTASGATTYTWTPNTNLSATTGASVTANPASTITYSVSGTTGTCTSNPVTVVVTVNTTPTVTLSAPPTICSGNSTTLTASGATTYTWAPNTNLSATTGASVTASPTTTITYSVTGTTGGCTSSTQTVIVTVNPTPTVTLSAPPTICSGNSTTLTASGATTYTWTPNTNLSATTGASVSASPTATTTYSVTGTTGTCTSNPVTVVVTVNTTPTVTLSAPPTICSGNSTVLTASGATTYSWSPNTNLSAVTGASVTASPTVTTTYSVTGTTGTCTSTAQSIIVTVNTTPTVTLSAPPTICSGNSTTLTASGATTYSWTPSSSLSASTGTSVSATPTVTTTYSITGTTGTCTSTAATVIVTVNTTPTVTLSAPPTICSGGSTVLTASGATTYTWTPNTNLSATTGASITASPTSTITYSVSGTTGTCTSTAATVVVTVNTTPTVTLSAPPTICSGNSTTLTASGATTYTWTPSSSLSASTGTSVSATPTVTTTYSITGTTGTCTSAVATVIVTVNPTPTLTLSAPPTICPGNSTTLTASGATTYTWTPNTNLSATTGASVSASPTVTTTYSVSGTTGSCTSSPQTIVVTVTATPTVTLSSPPTICSGTSTTLTASGAITYTWAPNTNLSATTGASVTASPTSTITYTVIGTSGCPGTPATIVVTVNPIPVAPTASSNSPICLGGTINLSASAIAGATYAWTGPNSFTSSSQTPTIAGATLTDAGIYSVTATVSGCTGPAGTTTVVVNPPPSAPTVGSNSPVCSGNTLNLTASAIASATYLWTGPNTFSSSSQNPNIVSVTTAAAGTYSVTATVPGCVTSPAGTVTVVVNPTPTVTLSAPPTICSGTSTTLTASGATTYTWTPNTNLSATTGASVTANPTSTTTYTVTGTTTGCPSAPKTIIVTVNPIPATPTAGSNSPVCLGMAINLTASTVAGTTYSWTGPNGFTSSSQNPNIATSVLADSGLYSVTATALGCTSPAGTTYVIVSLPPVAPTAGSNSPVCSGNTLNLTAGTVATATYSWTGPATFTSSAQNPSIVNVTTAASGTYSVTVTVPGCTTSPAGTTTVVVNATPAAPSASSNGPLCSGSTLTLTAGTIAGATYSWTGPNTFTASTQTANITNVTTANAGTYSVTATANGCTGPAGTVTVAINDPAIVSAGSGQTVCANNDSVKLSGTSSTGFAQWSSSGTGTFKPNNTTLNATYIPSNADTAAGTVTLTITSKNNGACAPVTDHLVVTITHAPHANAGSNQTVCGNNANVTLNGSFNSAASGAIWTTSGTGTFSPNNTTMNAVYTPSSADTAAGVVTFTLTTTGNGQCKAVTSTMTVTITNAPVVNAGSNLSACKNNANVTLSGTSSTGAGIWSTSGTGTFSPNNTTLNATYIASSADTAAGSVMLTLTSGSNGTCFAVNQSITVTYTPIPKVTTGPNVTVCANNDSISLTGTSTTGTGQWSTSGSGTFSPNNTTLNATYIPSNADTAAGSVTLTLSSTNNATCLGVSKGMTVNFTHAPSDEAGPNTSVCANNANVTLNGSFNSAATGAIWSTSGSGTFSPNNTTMNAVYIPSNADTASHNVLLILTTTGNGQCKAVTDSMNIVYTSAPNVEAGSDVKVCLSSPNYTLSGHSSTTKGVWTTLGSGTFSPNNTTLGATYVPSSADTAAHSVTLILTSTNNGGCNAVSDSVTITYTKTPSVSAGTNQTVCANNDDVTLNGTSSTGTGIWTTSGSGAFTPSNTTLNATYIPSNADTTAGSVNLTFTATGGCSPTAKTITITITHAPYVNAGPDQSLCKNNDVATLTGKVSGGATTGMWSTSGTGIFSPNNTTLNATYTPSSADTAAGGVMLVLTSTGNGSCNPVSDTVNIHYTLPPKVNAGPDQSGCAKETVALNGKVTGGGGTGIWSTVNGTGTFSPNNTTLTASYIPSAGDTLAGSIKVVLTSTNNGGCTPVTDTMVITVSPDPIVYAGADQSVCKNNGNVSLSGSVKDATGGVWSTSGSGTFSPNNTTLNGSYIPSSGDTTAGTVKLVLTSTGNGQCTAVTDTMVVTFTPSPTVYPGNNITACKNNSDALLNGFSSTGKGIWNTSGTGTFSPNDSALNATYISSAADITAGSVTLTLTSTHNATCSAVNGSLVITFVPSPIVNAGSDQTVCANNDSVSLSGSSSTGSGQWTTSGTGSFSPNNTSLNATYVPSNADTTFKTVKLVLTSTSNASCLAVSDTMVVTITPAPSANAGIDQTVCANNDAVTLNGSFTVASGAIWSTTGSGTFSPNNTTMSATYMPSAADTAARSVSIILTTTGNGQCKAATDTMNITITPAPKVNAGANTAVCLSSPDYTLNGYSSTGAGQWSTSGTGTFSPNNTTLGATYVPSTADTTAKTVTLILTSTGNGTCNAVPDTIVLNYVEPPTVNAGTNQTVCGNNDNVTLNGFSSTGTGQWSTSGSGTFSPNNTTPNATYVPSNADTTAGSVTLTYTTTGGCTPVSQSIVITITHAPYVNAGADVFVCKTSPDVTLNGTVSGGASTGVWTTSGSGTFNPGNTVMNAIYVPSTADTTAGSVTIVLTSTGNGICKAVTDTMIIHYTTTPRAVAGPDMTSCTNNSAHLNGTVYGGAGTGIWTTPNGGGTFVPNDSSLTASYNPANSDTIVKNVQLVLTSTNNGGCTASSDTLIVTVHPGPIVNAGIDQSVCANNATVSLSGSVKVATGGMWISSGSGSFAPNDSDLNATYTPGASAIASGKDTIYLVSTGNGICQQVTDTMIVTFTPAPHVNAGSNIYLCSGSSMIASLNGNITGGASTGIWSTLGSGTFSPNATTLNATYNLSPADTIAKVVKLVLTSTGNGSCNAVTDTLLVTVTPSSVVSAGSDTTVCGNSTIQLNGSVNGGTTTGVWATRGDGTFTPNDSALNATYNPGSADTAKGSVTLVLTSYGGTFCKAASDSMVASFKPTTHVNAGSDIYLCPGAGMSVILNGKVSGGSSTGIWSTLGTGTFTPNDSALNATYNLSTADTASKLVTLVLTSTHNNVCGATTDTLLVKMTSSPLANAGPDTTVCGSSIVQLHGTMNGGSGKGIWTTSGNGTFSPNDSVLNATYTPGSADTAKGSATLVLTSYGGTFCKVSSDTMQAFFNHITHVNAGADIYLCSGAGMSVTLNGKVSGGSATGIWSTLGSGTFSPNDSTLNATYNLSIADTTAKLVTLVLTSTHNNVCGATTDTVLVKMSTSPLTNAGVDTTVCGNSIVQLHGTINGGSGKGTWSTSGTGTFSPNDSALNAMYTPSSADTTAGSVKLILTSTSGSFCKQSSDTMVATFNPEPYVNAGSTITLCSGSSMTASLNGIVSGGSHTGVWTTVGSGTFSPNDSTLNATYNLSTADTTAKAVKLVLTSTHNGTCGSVHDTVLIKITTAPVVFAGKDTTICSNDTLIKLSGKVTGGSGKGIWSTTGSGKFSPNDSVMNPSYKPSSADTAAKNITFVLTALYACSPVSDSMTVTFSPAPKAEAGANQAICSGSAVQLNGSVSVSGGGKWSSSGTGSFVPNDSTLTADYIPSAADIGSGNVSIVLVTTNNKGCLAVKDTMDISIQSKPVASFVNSKACLNSNILFTDSSKVSSGSITSWKWNFGNGTSTLQDPTDTFGISGIHVVSLIVSTGAGCADTLAKSIYINPLPVAQFAFTTFCPDSAMFTDGSTISTGTIKAWSWMFGDSTSSVLQNPTHTYPKSGDYFITLKVTSDSGCSASSSDSVKEIPCNANGVSTPGVPTAFTPNGDGNNDVLYVMGGPFTLLDFRVFNEWGNQVFETQTQSSGWDGKFHSQAQPEGTYVWTLTGTTIDGKPVKMTGVVTIIR